MAETKMNKNAEFDFENLPEGIYSFSGKEGFVKVEVDKNGNQKWDLENWFDNLDPDKTEEQRERTIQEIKQRLNADTGMINSRGKDKNINFLTRLINIKKN
tara:strand:+ start:1814 stop:2116 length:303 start_codon:yes stop_codon:yes gene_type:complete